MKLPFVLTVSLLSGALAYSAPLKKATFTRVVNDVKLLPEQQQPKPAKIGDLVSGSTSVTTGVQSRAELKFEDNSLTRLGANSVFTIEQGTRNVDLKQGVMLLQVPKQLGGAKVRTAAVTAAVTGTTIMVEYQPDGYVKIIVLEGSIDLFLNEDPSVFRTFTSGDMVIARTANLKTIPDAVKVDLPLLKKTSKLTDDKEFGPLGNDKQLKQADAQQNQQKQKGDLSETALKIEGKGNIVVVDADRIRDLVPGVTAVNTPNGGGTPPATNGGPETPRVPSDKAGVPGMLGGVAVIDNQTLIVTDPIIKTKFSGTLATGAGKIYRPGTDANLGQAFFQSNTRYLGEELKGQPSLMDQKLQAAGSWAAYRFEEAYLVGDPNIDTRGGPRNLLLVSDSDFVLSAQDPFNIYSTDTGSWNLGASPLKNVTIAARNNIDWESGYSITGTNQNLYLYTHVATDEPNNVSPVPGSSSGDINIFSSTPVISLPQGTVEMHAARDLLISGTSSVNPPNLIQAKNINLTADRDITIGSDAGLRAVDSMKIRARQHITIFDSTALRRLSNESLLAIEMIAQTGDISSLGSSGRPVTIEANTVDLEARLGHITLEHTNINSDFLRVQTLGTNGTILIGSSNLTATQAMNIYADGSNGTVRFVADSRLTGPSVSVAGHTVQVDNGVRVNVSNPNGFNVYSDNENFNRSGYGNFSTNGSNINFVPAGSTGAHKGTFSSRP